MTKFRKFALLACIAAVGGCVAIESSTLNDSGVVYFLPKTMLKITVTQYKDTTNGRTWYQLGGAVRAAKAENNGNYVNPGIIDLSATDMESTEIPDADHRYVSQYRPVPTSSDRLCISRTQTGLLNDVDFASDDRTPAIVVNLARIVAGSQERLLTTGITTNQAGGTSTVEVRSYTSNIDPLSHHDRELFKRALGEVFGERLEIDVSRMKELFKSHSAPLPDDCRDNDRCSSHAFTDRCTRDNICYRTRMKVPIELKRNGKGVDINYADVINPYDIGAISVTRAFLVHKISKFKFLNGVLVGAVVRKPSELEAASLLPLQAVYAALATPSAAFSTGFGSSTTQQKVILLENYNTLAGKITDLQNSVKNVEAGLTGPTFGTLSKDYAITSGETYNMSCTVPNGTNGIVDLITNIKLN